MKSNSHNSWGKSKILIISLVAATVLAVVLITGYITVWNAPNNNDKADKIRKELETKIDKGITVSPDKNAWTYYEKAAKSFRWFDDDSKKKVYAFRAIMEFDVNKKNEKIIQQKMEKNRKSLELAGKAFNIEHFQVIRDYKNSDGEGFAEELPDTMAFRKFIYFLCLSGEYEAFRDNNMKAAERYMQALYFSKGIFRNGKYIFESNIYYDVVLDKLTEFILKSDGEAKVYKYIVNQMVRIDKHNPPFTDIFKQEILSIHYYYKSQREGGKVKFLNMLLNNREEKLLNNLCLEILKIDYSNYQKVREEFSHLKDKVNRYSGSAYEYSKNQYPQVYESYIKGKVKYEGTLILSALMWYKKEKGSFPGKLSQLVPKYLPELPVDPYSKTGEFIYKKDGETVSFYSVGSNLVDDGGLAESVEVADPKDIVFIDNDD